MQIKQYQTTKYIMGNGALREVQRWKDKKIGLVVDENVLKALQLETKLFDELLKDCDYEAVSYTHLDVYKRQEESYNRKPPEPHENSAQ